VDGDGDPDEHCAGGGDCNDLDPNVASTHPEVCANGVDDNCNGQIDETPCVVPQGTSCGSAYLVAGPGTYHFSTLGSGEGFATSCSVSRPSAAQSVVAAISIPPGPARDLEVWATTAGVEVAVAIQGVCGQSSSEISCGSGSMATSVGARAHRLSPGIYYAVVTTQSPTFFDLSVQLPAATPPATNVDCSTAMAIQAGTPTPVQVLDPSTNLPSMCHPSTGERTYSISLTQPQDLRVYTTVVQGSGKPVVGLRDPTCVGGSDELACQASGSAPLYARGLAAGTYVITVAASSPIDATLDVEVSPPSPATPDQTCASPPSVTPNGRVAFDLSDHEKAIQDGCFATATNFVGGSDAAYALRLASASDVLLVERFPQTDNGALSLDAPACTSTVGCATGADPLRLGKRNVAAGEYRAVIADQLGLQGTLDALVRPTVAPTIIPGDGADGCGAAIDLGTGGFFTGDTSMGSPHYGNPCDAPTSPPGGAPDQTFGLLLGQPQRVVLDMEGSSYTTILDVRQGSTCPGMPVTGGCFVGFSAQRSFLDIELPAGQYWIVVDGYQGASGPWNLDVRLLQPTL
jgi:hypothetical protein